VLNPVGIWQGNCFMGIHCSAAIHGLSFDTDSFESVLTAVAVMCTFAIVLPNRTTPPATREAGLVQIANAPIEKQIGPNMSCVYLNTRLYFRLACQTPEPVNCAARNFSAILHLRPKLARKTWPTISDHPIK
jgi:hypothetical protein